MLKRVVEIWLLAFPPAAAISSTICPRRIAGQIGKYNIPLQLQYLGSLLLADGQANLVTYSPNHSWTPQKATEVKLAHLFLLFSCYKTRSWTIIYNSLQKYSVSLETHTHKVQKSLPAPLSAIADFLCFPKMLQKSSIGR
jgi:hypothetical protein